MAEFRILDKDLDRVANAESAGLHSTRAVFRLGLALTFAAVVAIVGTLAGAALSGMLVAGMLVATFLALSIGANDVANALGPPVGAGAISMSAGLILVALAEIAGAMLAGGRVTETLTTGILPADLMHQGTEPATVMLAAMLAAAIWITLATWAGAPVSTTHAIVGGISGAGLVVFGPGALQWRGLAGIATAWIAAPIVAALAGAALLAVLRRAIHRAPDRARAAARLLPWVVGCIAAVLTLNALSLSGVGAPVVLGATFAVSAASVVFARIRMADEIAAGHPGRQMLDRMLGPPLVLGAILMGFSHGSNDVANIVAPLAVLGRSTELWPQAEPTSIRLLALGGAGIAVGALLFGRRLVHMVGSRITRLNTARALCVSLATSLTVLAATRLGMPVSTTHVAVGGVFGVGFYREWEERRFRSARTRARKPLPPEELRRLQLVRRAAVLRTLAAWVVTLPAAGVLAATLAWMIG
ncbi:inorganic phosphate transporter [Paracoccus sp. MC1862]|uniref:inorganic phosphate transporter n=1 Tax=Paracoccus sp. MC1862 TaxID=2760307 RepID=UPI00160234B1|nr:inorganic phosphate transporter [Paracoccus sp. MC1862]MBB1498748.1 inorganic phosphate transporter [Paracoccus sp. MC1862]QQO43909.1 inorganic phosphate transporter [Paracoccus sp. MC1862]